MREDKDYHALFYALLMRKCHELGVSPVPTGPSKDLPESAHAPYEDAIRHAGRLVGGLYLQEGRLPEAWWYFRMLGEPGPVKAALEARQPAEGDDVQSLVQIAFYEGVHPRKGFDWVLERFGICSAITTLGGQEVAATRRKTGNTACNGWCKPSIRSCASGGGGDRAARRPTSSGGRRRRRRAVLKLIEGRDWLFQDDGYHIDTSHLSSVVQMGVDLPPCRELHLAREMCAYGKRLSVRFRGRNEPPFEDMYEAYDKYSAS